MNYFYDENMAKQICAQMGLAWNDNPDYSKEPKPSDLFSDLHDDKQIFTGSMEYFPSQKSIDLSQTQSPYNVIKNYVMQSRFSYTCNDDTRQYNTSCHTPNQPTLCKQVKRESSWHTVKTDLKDIA